MEKRIMANVCRCYVIIIALSFAASAVHAQLFNGDFETTGTNYTFPDNGDMAFPVLSNTFAAGWTPFSGAYCARTATNGPQQGTYEELTIGYDFFGINQSKSNGIPTTTSHGGLYSLRTFGTFTNQCCGGSGAGQIISSNTVAAISNNTIWVLSGFVLNWSGDPLSDSLAGIQNFGCLQIVFLDTNNVFLGSQDGTHWGTNNATLDVWQPTSVTATSPAGTAAIEFIAEHVGQSGALGSLFFDDLSVTNTGVAPPPPPPPPVVTNQFQAVIQVGNQVCWPTVNNTSYQAQSSDDNVTWTDFGTRTPGDGTTNCAFGVTHKFYRVQQLP